MSSLWLERKHQWAKFIWICVTLYSHVTYDNPTKYYRHWQMKNLSAYYFSPQVIWVTNYQKSNSLFCDANGLTHCLLNYFHSLFGSLSVPNFWSNKRFISLISLIYTPNYSGWSNLAIIHSRPSGLNILNKLAKCPGHNNLVVIWKLNSLKLPLQAK